MIMNILKTIGAIILSIVCIWGSIKLKILGVIGEISLLTLIGGSCLTGLLIAFSHRIKDFSLAKLSIQLYELKSIQKDVIAREENIRDISIILGEIIIFTNTIRGFNLTKHSMGLHNEWLELKINKLMTAISASPTDKDKVFMPSKLFKNIFQQGRHDEDLVRKGWEDFWAYIDSDIKRMKE